MKKLISLALAMVLTLALAIPTGAVETKTATATKEVSVIVNNKALTFPTDAQPEIKNGSTMVPFKAFVEAMGGKLVATEGGFSCDFGSGPYARLKNFFWQPGTSNSYMKNGYTYVKLSEFAGFTGSDLLWDRESRSAVLINKQDLINEINENFTVMNTAMEKNYTDPTQNYKSTATYDITMNIPAATEGDTAINGTMKMKLDMISSATAMEMKGTLDASMLAPLLDLDGAVKDGTIPAAEAAALRKALANSTFQMRFDLTTGDFYMNMGLLSAISGGQIPAETWMKLSLKDLLSEMSLSELMDLQGEKQTIGELIYAFGRAAASSETGGNARLYDDVKTAADLTAAFLGDKSAKQSSGSYQFHIDSAAINAKAGEDVMSDVFDAFVLDITVNGGAVTCKFDIKTSDGTVQGQTGMKLGLNGSVTMNAGKTSLTMNLDMGELGSAKYLLNMTMTPTTQKPVATPPAGAKVMDLNDLLESALATTPVISTLPAVPTVPAA